MDVYPNKTSKFYRVVFISSSAIQRISTIDVLLIIIIKFEIFFA